VNPFGVGRLRVQTDFSEATQATVARLRAAAAAALAALPFSPQSAEFSLLLRAVARFFCERCGSGAGKLRDLRAFLAARDGPLAGAPAPRDAGAFAAWLKTGLQALEDANRAMIMVWVRR